jgi:hypothetical protein
MKLKHVLFAAIPLLLGLVVFCASYFSLGLHKSPEEKGKDLNQRAWEQAFTDRGLAAPTTGPRDGWGSSLLMPRVANPAVGWIEREQHVPGMLNVDRDGSQFWRSETTPVARLLIVGASVAFGVGASSEEATYFAVLGRSLERQGMPVEIKVHAAGAWKSSQEVACIREELALGRFDVVILLDGLNDLLIGATVDGLFEHNTGGRQSNHAGDYEARVAGYFGNVSMCEELCLAHGSRLLVVLQPALFEKKDMSSLERQVLRATFSGVQSYGEMLFAPYQSMRSGLANMSNDHRIDFLDCSRLFNAEQATTFTDTWHLSDPGQSILGEAIAKKLLVISRT